MNEKAAAVWYAALRAEIGVVVLTDDTFRCKQELYAARSEIGDPALDALSIAAVKDDDERIWVLKRGRSDGET
jgi:hypothetical protein